MINDDIKTKALTNTINKIAQENKDSGELVIVATLILSVYIKELDNLMKEDI